jgi:hypothetical protein
MCPVIPGPNKRGLSYLDSKEISAFKAFCMARSQVLLKAAKTKPLWAVLETLVIFAEISEAVY